MDYDDYLREQASQFRRLAEGAQEPPIKAELFELAEICEEIANTVEDQMTAG